MVMLADRRQDLAALVRSLSRSSASVMTKSAVADHILVVKVDSTVALPSEPDPDSIGSSSCVSIFSWYSGVRIKIVVLTESSNFHTGTPLDFSLYDEV